MRTAIGRPRYRPPILPREMQKGLRVVDVQTGFFIYTSQAVPYRGGWTDARLGPRFDPRANRYEQ